MGWPWDIFTFVFLPQTSLRSDPILTSNLTNKIPDSYLKHDDKGQPGSENVPELRGSAVLVIFPWRISEVFVSGDNRNTLYTLAPYKLTSYTFASYLSISFV